MINSIYNIPGAQCESMDMCCESSNPNMEKKFINATTQHVIEALDVNYNERRIVEPLLTKYLSNKMDSHYKGEGLLQQYEAYILERAGERFTNELEIPEEIKINHDHATHAKYADVVDYLKAEDKKKFLEDFNKKKK